MLMIAGARTMKLTSFTILPKKIRINRYTSMIELER